MTSLPGTSGPTGAQPLVRNAADRQQVREAKSKERRTKLDAANDMLYVLNNPSGRRVLWRILEQCGVFSAGYVPPDQLLFREGSRNVGIYVIDQITAARPNALIDMMLEAQKAKESSA